MLMQSSCCCSGDCNVTGESETALTSVDVVPSKVYARGNTSFQLRVVARDNNGVVRELDEVEWSSTSEDLTLIGATDQMVVNVKTTPPSELIAFGEVNVTVNGMHEATADIKVARTLEGDLTGADRVRVSHVTNSSPEAVMLRATDETTGDCVRDLTRAVADLAVMEEDFVPDPDCDNRVAVFSTDHSVHYEPLTTSFWQNGTDEMKRDLNPPTQVSLVAWYFVSFGLDEIRDDAKSDVDIANAMYGMNRAGMQFSIDREEVKQGRSFAFDCDDPVAALGQEELEQPDGIHVVFADLISGTKSGYSCTNPDGFTVRIIVLSAGPLGLKGERTLAHELGHSLALRNPPLARFGHTGGVLFEVEGFDTGNLMWAFPAAKQHHISLGQAFRMAVDERSWVNEAGIRQEPTEHCQENPLFGTCPALCKDIVDLTNPNPPPQCRPAP